jgi:primary-amine oxidase
LKEKIYFNHVKCSFASPAHPFDFLVVYSHPTSSVIAIEELPIDQNGNSGSAYDQETLVPRNNTNYDPQLRSEDFFRKDDNPIVVDSPQGPSFKIEGTEINWQKFRFRLGYSEKLKCIS